MRPSNLDGADMNDKAPDQQAHAHLGFGIESAEQDNQDEYAAARAKPQAKQDHQRPGQWRGAVGFIDAEMGVQQPLKQRAEHHECRRKTNEIAAEHLWRRQPGEHRDGHQIEDRSGQT